MPLDWNAWEIEPGSAVDEQLIAQVQPEIVLHLAAQPLVREGYRDPLGTYSSNVMGTLNLPSLAIAVSGAGAAGQLFATAAQGGGGALLAPIIDGTLTDGEV